MLTFKRINFSLRKFGFTHFKDCFIIRNTSCVTNLFGHIILDIICNIIKEALTDHEKTWRDLTELEHKDKNY